MNDVHLLLAFVDFSEHKLQVRISLSVALVEQFLVGLLEGTVGIRFGETG